jgi:hypothetical protein
MSGKPRYLPIASTSHNAIHEKVPHELFNAIFGRIHLDRSERDWDTTHETWSTLPRPVCHLLNSHDKPFPLTAKPLLSRKRFFLSERPWYRKTHWHHRHHTRFRTLNRESFATASLDCRRSDVSLIGHFALLSSRGTTGLVLRRLPWRWECIHDLETSGWTLCNCGLGHIGDLCYRLRHLQGQHGGNRSMRQKDGADLVFGFVFLLKPQNLNR